MEELNVENKLIRRSLPVIGFSNYGEKEVIVSTCMLGFARILPGECWRSKGKDFKFLGITNDDDSSLLFMDLENNEICKKNPVDFDLIV